MRKRVLRADAELAGVVVPPTERGARAREPAGEVRARDDGRERRRVVHGHRLLARHRRAVAELPPGVVAPAVCRPVGGERARVCAASGDGGEPRRPGDRYRGVAAGIVVTDLAVVTGGAGRGGAQLPVVVRAPAPRRTVHGDTTGVLVAGVVGIAPSGAERSEPEPAGHDRM